MDYIILAKDLLRKKKQLENAYVETGYELEALEAQCGPNISVYSAVAAGKSVENKYEDYLVAVLWRIENTKLRRIIIKRELELLENGLKCLDDYERDLLEVFFISNEKRACEKLMCKYYKERTAIYEDKNKALEKFTRSIYGVINL